MSYPVELKQKAISLRSQGYSIKEIARKLDISVSTASGWLRKVILESKAKARLKKRKLLGYYKTSQRWQRKKSEQEKRVQLKVKKVFAPARPDKNTYKIFCSLLFWAEGTKTGSYVSFINSDPQMIAVFLKLLRASFPLTEEKFRAMVHIHEYHDEKEILKFWSEKTNIPLSQFSKSYLKPHTKKRKKPGYMGSLRVRYYDAEIARELRAIYNNMLTKKLGA